MNRRLAILILSFAILSKCCAQNNITYSFETCVIDSLQKGINFYGTKYNIPIEKLKLCVLIISEDDGYGIYLQEYSHLPKSGLLELIKKTNRKLFISNHISFPVLFPVDVLSLQIKKDKIIGLPLSGYYVRVTNINYEQKVTNVSILF
jgi:hypothetical protein